MMRETTIAESARRVRGRTTANSSPPRRPATSRRRSVSRRAVPIWRSASSPVGWPSSSLTRCMRSTSKTISVAASRAASTARSASSWKWRRFGSRVRVSTSTRWRSLRCDASRWAMRRSWFMTSESCVIRSAITAVVSSAPRAASATRDQRAEIGEHHRQPGELDDRGGDHSQAQRAQRRAGREVLEAGDRGSHVQREEQRRHCVDLRIAHRLDRLDPGAHPSAGRRRRGRSGRPDSEIRVPPRE